MTLISLLWLCVSALFIIGNLYAPKSLVLQALSRSSWINCISSLLAIALKSLFYIHVKCFFELPLLNQIIQFIGISLTAYGFTWYRLKNKREVITNKNANFSVIDRLIHQEVVIHTLLAEGNVGYAAVNGLDWKVKWQSNELINVLQKARVTAFNERHLVVQIL